MRAFASRAWSHPRPECHAFPGSWTPEEERTHWLALYAGLMGEEGRKTDAEIFVTTAFEREGSGWLARIGRRIARELACESGSGLPSDTSRVVPFADVLARPCPVCSAPALVVGEELRGRDWDATVTTRVMTLCSSEPHVVELASKEGGGVRQPRGLRE